MRRPGRARFASAGSGDREMSPGRLSRRALLAALGSGLAAACDGGSKSTASPTPIANVQQEFRPTPPPAAGALAWASRAPLPTPRSEVASAVLDDKIFLIGGFTASGQNSNTVQVYDSARDLWEAMPALPQARDHAMAAALAGRVYVFGGGLGDATRTTFAFDEAARAWSRKADMPFRRTAGGAAVLGDRILIAGGAGDSPQETMVYDPATDRWSAGPALPAPREHLAVVSAGGAVYVIAGRWDLAPKDANEVLDSLSGRWRVLAPIPTPRGGTAGGVVNGRIYVAGGEAFDPSRTFPQVEVYDPSTNVWMKAPDLPTPRHGLAVQGVGDTLYVIGGGPTAGLSVAPQNEALSTR